MANEVFAKFKEIVANSQTFAVNTGKTSDTQKILSAAVLNSALKKLGKTVNFSFASISDSAKKIISAVLEEDTETNIQPKENILIKFDSKTLPVKELKYEKEGDFVKIILEGTGASLDTAKIAIEKELVPVDLLLLIDPKESEMDGILAGTKYKEVIKIGTRDKNLPLKIVGVVRALFDEIPESLRPALWYLIHEEEKTNPVPSKEGFAVLKELLDLGFNHQQIQKTGEELSASTFNNLLGRALARSRYEKTIATFWSFLPQSDIQKTMLGDSAMFGILHKIRSLNPQSRFYAFFWDSGKTGINGLLASADKEKLLALSGLFSTAPASSYFLVNSFDTFSEAEIKVRAAITQIINKYGG